MVSRNVFLDERSRQIVEVEHAKVWKFVGSLLLLLGEVMVVPLLVSNNSYTVYEITLRKAQGSLAQLQWILP